jgi:hypothetical protein
MRKPLLFGRSNLADVDDPRSWKQETKVKFMATETVMASRAFARSKTNGKLARCANRCDTCQPMARPKTQPAEQIHRDTAFLIHTSAVAERVYHRRRRFARFHEAHD